MPEVEVQARYRLASGNVKDLEVGIERYTLLSIRDVGPDEFPSHI